MSRDRRFAARFNSQNIEMIRGRRFATVVCAGVSAVKWLANKQPENDRAAINRLMDCLVGVTAARFVLISTIDVYRDPWGQTERDEPSTDGLHPYGLHRLELEDFVRRRFPVSTIARLPGLFGSGLKKNIIHDMIHLNSPENVASNAAFQWYHTRRLADDLDRIVAADIELINVTAEPIATGEIRDRFFPHVPLGAVVPDPPRYDVRSVHDTVLGGHGGYHFSAGQVLLELGSFLAEPRAAT